MFDAETIAQMNAIFQGAVKHHDRWKYIPASDARLKSMALIYHRDKNTIYFSDLVESLCKLNKDERDRFEEFLKND